MKIFTRGTAIAVCIWIIAVLFSVFLYSSLPNQMSSHWGVNGEVNGTMGRFWGTFFMPLLMFVMGAFILLIPHLDPKRHNIEVTRKTYDAMLIALMTFFSLIQFFILFSNLGYHINPSQFFAFTLGMLFFAMGFIIERTKQNWTIGIRTPWTLSSEVVWNKTHVLGGKVFKICGIVSCLGVIFPQVSFILFIVPVLISTIILFIYSYIEYKKEGK